jgi:hypothetical protein
MVFISAVVAGDAMLDKHAWPDSACMPVRPDTSSGTCSKIVDTGGMKPVFTENGFDPASTNAEANASASDAPASHCMPSAAARVY